MSGKHIITLSQRKGRYDTRSTWLTCCFLSFIYFFQCWSSATVLHVLHNRLLCSFLLYFFYLLTMIEWKYDYLNISRYEIFVSLLLALIKFPVKGSRESQSWKRNLSVVGVEISVAVDPYWLWQRLRIGGLKKLVLKKGIHERVGATFSLRSRIRLYLKLSFMHHYRSERLFDFMGRNTFYFFF